ncbi:MAG TPA: twin-arginine translocation signal domain-containing protein, partial [Kiloniellaceae bacterium]|nr:twin-arginine translocation signal domain-containing protein [Kiloniellaceae bacterium]
MSDNRDPFRLNRRRFLKGSALATGALALPQFAFADGHT